MKITAISIFPEYFTPLSLSLIGKAQAESLITFDAVDLRTYTNDPHRSVDDTPYGGGPGMVMKPEPWGDSIDALLANTEDCVDLVILTPGGNRFDQRYAEKLSKANDIIFACGRYEGIDARVAAYYANVERVRLHEISIGDFVLNGGEVAALVIIEAITRLIPGVIGNPQSLVEESHNELGQLEYPVYTKPAHWKGLSVPEILTSGNHGAIEKWRRERADEISASRRGHIGE